MVGNLQVPVSLPLNVIVGPQPFSFTISFLAIRRAACPTMWSHHNKLS